MGKIASYFPKRNKATIAAKAMALGLQSAKSWSDADNAILKRSFRFESKAKLLHLLPHRTWPAILAQGERLGAKRYRNRPRIEVNENYFKKWSPRMAFILGFILADGCIIKGTYKGYSDSLKFGVQLKDADIIEKIKKELESGHKISFVKNTAHFCVSSQQIVDDLKKLGIKYRKSLNEKIPNVPGKFKKDFIRGVIDGDGSIWYDSRNYPTLSLCGGKNTLTYVRDYFKKHFGANSTIGRRKFSKEAGNYLYQIAYRANTAKKLILHLYNNAEIFLDRKYNLAMKCEDIDMKERKNYSQNEKDSIRRHYNTGTPADFISILPTRKWENIQFQARKMKVYKRK